MNTELAWAAGFWDGEGSFCTVKNGEYRRLMMHMGQNSRVPLDRFREAVQGGKVYGPYQRKPDKRNVIRVETPYHTWSCQRHDENLRIAELLWPYLCTPARARILLALDHYIGRHASDVAAAARRLRARA